MEIQVALSTQEALARLADTEQVHCIFECRPNTGFSYTSHLSRQDLLAQIPKITVYESGAGGQSKDMGIYTGMHHPAHGPGVVFMATKPECRLNEQQLKESLQRGHGSDIFSG